MPYALIETLVEELGSRSWNNHGEPDRSGSATAGVHHRVSEAAVEVSAVLATTTITLAELRDMRPGDVVLTKVPTSALATICVEGRPKFTAAQGQHAGRRAVEVVSSLNGRS